MLSLDGSDPSHIGRYRLVGRLGEGGMGRVYLARSPGGRPTAVKVINDHLRHDEHALSRFRREVETLGTVRSAYTASLIDAELDTPPYWLATEYVPGPTLHAAVVANGPLPADLARVMLAALAEGLDAIHVRGVWHRDLKPHNVILSATGPQLIDFGIARTTGTSNLTQVGGAMGSPGFIAPETITGGETGPGADVFALGATLAFAVTGRPPYGDGPFAAVSYRSVHGEIDVRGVDAGVAELIVACAQSDPALRPTPHQIVELCRAEADLVHHPAYQQALAVGSLTDRERAATVGDNGSRGSTTASDAMTAVAPRTAAAMDGGAREAHAATLLAPNPGLDTPTQPHVADIYGPYPMGTGPTPPRTAQAPEANWGVARSGPPSAWPRWSSSPAPGCSCSTPLTTRATATGRARTRRPPMSHRPQAPAAPPTCRPPRPQAERRRLLPPPLPAQVRGTWPTPWW